jgi:hypothetical protein
MPASRALMLGLGLALAAPVAAYAYDGASTPMRHHEMRHHHGPVLRRAVHPSARAEAPAAAAFPVSGFWSPKYVPAPEEHETDGLSRNPDDCVTYGCVDNN